MEKWEENKGERENKRNAKPFLEKDSSNDH